MKNKIKETIKKSILYTLYIKIEDHVLHKKRLPYIYKLEKIINKDTTIISSNCFAGRIYQDLNFRYNSPTVGLYFMYPDYIEFLSNINYYINCPIIFTKKSKYALGNERILRKSDPYPIGLIDGKIEIHFLHYKTENEAIEKWQRRCRRINFKNIIIIGMEQNQCTKEDIIKFDKLPFDRKYMFSTQSINSKSNIYIPYFVNKKEVGDPYKKGHIFYKYLLKHLRQ